MPMLPETVSALYGCLKVGAIAVPIFSGFGTEAAATRLADAECSVLLAANGFYRRGSVVSLTEVANEAIAQAGCVEQSVVLERVDNDETITAAESQSWTEAIDSQSARFDTAILDSSHPSMLLYSSGTTGKPKGIVHTHAGLQLQPTKEVYFGFDHKESDLFFWVSDLGWLMGPWTLIGNHTLGGAVFLYEGAPDFPEPDRYWEMIERHDITTFGISPTAIRTLQKHGQNWVDDHDLSSLRLLGSTGGPWDRESWMWFYEHVGRESTPIINISGGTEIGGCFLMPMPDQPLKPCSLGSPSPGMNVDIVDEAGNSVVKTGEQGYLVARDSCPGFTDSLWSGDERYLEEYWSTWDDLWDHGDWAQCDEDGFWYILGRSDDALNVAGKKVGPAEIESVLIGNDAVNQAAVCGVSDETSGTAVVAFVVLERGRSGDEALTRRLTELVGSEHGKPFRPREILYVEELPKTQSGKVVRRALSAVYDGEDPGDLSSIENPDSLARIEAQLV
jgi:acetyl-CoA synthetase